MKFISPSLFLLISISPSWGVETYRVHAMDQAPPGLGFYNFALGEQGHIAFDGANGAFRYSTMSGSVAIPGLTVVGDMLEDGTLMGTRYPTTALDYVLTISESGVETPYINTGSIHFNYGVAMNENGLVVGKAYFNLSDERAYVWSSPTTYAELPQERQPDSTNVADINNSNRAVGRSVRRGQGTVPTYWDLNDPTNPQIHYYERYYTQSSSTEMTAINENGVAIGNSRLDLISSRVNILWGPDGQILHVLPNSSLVRLTDINDFGLAVGGRSIGGVPGGILYSIADGYTDVNTLLEPSSQSYHIDGCYKINNRGDILGTATRNGQQYAVYLEPVPEPLTLVGLGLGLVTILRRRR